MDREADVRLVRQVLDGDGRAEAELLDRLLPHLRSVARATLANPADVDDAVQVALMRVLEGLSGFRGDASLVRWARRVAAHACLRQREQNVRRLRLVELGADEDAMAGPTPEARLGEGLPRHVAEYLEQLPAVQREVLVLRHVLDHSVAEVAELVGAPIDTVKSRLLYARRAVRALIRRDEALASQRGRAEA
ncbi:RNA polymerase sigma factor [Paraliomyxa miuraensis]|uniref:RNA polymerase sigma factor n=1 Tax=Paraliomyxa miuraensis TaxID=376150 RepID=UPI0022532276|nr:RNA polymerase sigma factor [Paraliomyxa miuraensis]MCX4242557.1 RNA polymerase sigma factor [Paraliomyxa miuraensis]